MDYKKMLLLLVVLISLFNAPSYAADQSNIDRKYLNWQQLPDFPDKLGVGGAFVGVSNDALIIAGGANFPDPASPNKKQFYDKIWVLTKSKSQNDQAVQYKWLDGGRLDVAIGYGGATSTSQGVVCVGGCNGSKVFDSAFILTWDPVKKVVTKRTLPSLPKPCAYTSIASIGDTVYVAGGEDSISPETVMNNFWSLDLSEEKNAWRELPSWPGPARALNITVAQHNGEKDCIYVISGKSIESDSGISETIFLKDVYEFNPYEFEKGSTAWRKRKDVPVCVMAGAGIGVGQSHIFVLGGVNGEASDGKEKDLSNYSWAYHTITDTWVKADKLESNQITTIPVKWGNSIILASGEIRPLVRTSKIWKINPVKIKGSFGVVNIATLILYLLAMVGVGLFFASRNKDTDDYFRGGQRINWIVASLSIFATMLSSITFLSVPAAAYATNWAFLVLNIGIIVVAPFVIKMVLPFFRKIDAVSAYEYLEKRFDVSVRLFASLAFTVFQIGRMAIVLYLPALALSAITPLSDIQCVLIMGVISTIYCTMGGIEAVLWTDAIQTVILLGAALLSFVLIIKNIDGGMGQFISVAASDDKFHVFDWDWSARSYTTGVFWVLLIGGIGQTIIPYTSDQAVIQRYMVTPTEKKAAKAIWGNAIIGTVSAFLFFGLGTALYIFYKTNPAQLDPTFKTDAIFPLFIARQLPIGVAGIVVAGVFAAAQSTLSTSLNSVSSTITSDFIQRFNVVSSERAYLNVARILTVLLGCLGTGFAILLVVSDIRSAWTTFMAVLGLFGSSMCGLFLLGIFTTRVTSLGALLGATASMMVLLALWNFTEVDSLLYGAIGVSLCFVFGYVFSLLLPKDKKALDGLTIHSLVTDEKNN